MKFWRTFSTVALVGAFAATSSFAAFQPKAPASAQFASSSTTSSNADCAKNTDSKTTFPLVMSGCFQEATNTAVGNQFPWESSTFFFSSYRNQYLWTAAAVGGTQGATIESIHARASSFSGSGTMAYTSSARGDSHMSVEDALGSSLVATFSFNVGTDRGRLTNTNQGGDIVLASFTGPNGSTLSTCTSCAGTDPPLGSRDMWFDSIDTATSGPVVTDHNSFVNAAGSAGGPIWDTASAAFGGGCTDAGSRAYGSGSFANPFHLTTALGIDNFDFVWVHAGKGLPPAANVEQQIAEIIRLLLTPEGLRCSGLDMTPGNPKNDDDPVAFPDGADIDPIMPQVTTGGFITGDENKDARRSAGFNP